MKFMVEIDAPEGGWIHVYCPSLQGQTREEALENIREAIMAWPEAEEIEGEQIAARDKHEVSFVEVAG
ncbi:type II toxin-antitoxin system HicB family antitoxin [bacterium]|nr:type II toxin-antitoxin system HicB family antitoxin [bacterium]